MSLEAASSAVEIIGVTDCRATNWAVGRPSGSPFHDGTIVIVQEQHSIIVNFSDKDVLNLVEIYHA